MARRLLDLAPVRSVTRFVRWYVGSLRNYKYPPTVSYSAERVRIVDHLEHDFGFAWKNVRRIGWRVRSGWFADHLLELQLADGSAVGIDYEYQGAPGLVRYVDQLPGTKYIPGRGALANVLDDDSVVTGPALRLGRRWIADPARVGRDAGSRSVGSGSPN